MNNYAFIAENTTKYYLELSRHYKDRFNTKANLLATAGVLDAQNYIFVKNPQMTVAEILDMANEVVSEKNMVVNVIARSTMEAEQGRITSADILTRAYLWEIDLLTQFIIALEVKIFEADSDISVWDIIDAFPTEVANIERTVQKTRGKNASERMFNLATANFMESSQFEAIRNQLGIKEMEMEIPSD